MRKQGELLTDAPIEDFLRPVPLVEVDSADVGKFVEQQLSGCDDIEKAKRVFEFVRDDVAHSWDIQGHRVTRSACDVLKYREGICYAKSHLAAALLRRAGVPTGICYQRLTLFDDESGGYAVHALNTVYIKPLGRWIRFDARGNKAGINAQFSLGPEQLAFPVRSHLGEIDYYYNHPEPHPVVANTLLENDDALIMYRERLPQEISY